MAYKNETKYSCNGGYLPSYILLQRWICRLLYTHAMLDTSILTHATMDVKSRLTNVNRFIALNFKWNF